MDKKITKFNFDTINEPHLIFTKDWLKNKAKENKDIYFYFPSNIDINTQFPLKFEVKK